MDKWDRISREKRLPTATLISAARTNLSLFKIFLEFHNYDNLLSRLTNKKLYAAAEIVLDRYDYKQDYEIAILNCCIQDNLILSGKIFLKINVILSDMYKVIDYCIKNKKYEFVYLFITLKKECKDYVIRATIRFNDYQLLINLMNYNMMNYVDQFMIKNSSDDIKILLLKYYTFSYAYLYENEIITTYIRMKSVFNDIRKIDMKIIWEKRNVILFLRKSCLFPGVVQDYIDFINKPWIDMSSLKMFTMRRFK